MQYACSVDIGGTFTDCTLVDENGDTYTGKARSTPEDDFQSGFFDSIEQVGNKAGEEFEDIVKKLVRITHGTTIANNAIIENKTADVGLITTRGQEDTLTMMRGNGRVTGEPPENTLKVAEMRRPEPLVPRGRTAGVIERVDDEGEVIVDLNEDNLEQAIEHLVEKNVEGLAVSFLWSFKNPEHEQKTAEIIQEKTDDDIYLSLSHEVTPTLGEYERTVTTVIDAMVGPIVREYVEKLQTKLRDEHGFEGTFLLMGSNGGCYTAEQAANRPVMLIDSGPVGGLKGCQEVSKASDNKTNILATDMGGTSFELGLIQDQHPLVQKNPVFLKYNYSIPKLDIESIGAGGGSLIKVSEGSLKVGPESAGADPGPACYDRGSIDPTITDADLYLGFIDPEATFGTKGFQPSLDLAEQSFESIADELGQSPREVAAGAFRVVNTKMANLVEKNVIGRGYDPRDFHLISYGGAGPLHASSYAKLLDVESIMVPGNISPVWSAYGILNTDIRQEVSQEVVHLEPFNTKEIEEDYQAIESEGRRGLVQQGFDGKDITFDRYALMRFEGQYHELEIPVPSTIEDELLTDRFVSEYQERYSAAAIAPDSRAEIRRIRVEPVVPTEEFQRVKMKEQEKIPEPAHIGSREIYWPEEEASVNTDVYDGTMLRPGNEINGPTVIDMTNTTIVVREGQTIKQNRYGDFIIKNGSDKYV